MLNDLKEIIKEYIENRIEVVSSESYDCYEIAEDIQSILFNKFKRFGCIITFKPKDKSRMLKVLDYGQVEEYVYHSVFLYCGYVIDIRSIKDTDDISFDTYAVYTQKLQDLNPEIEIIEERS